MLEVIFSSIPLDVEVVLDGEYIGHTPIIRHPVSYGEHTVQMKSPGGSVSREITVGRRSPSRFIWTVSEGHWEATF